MNLKTKSGKKISLLDSPLTPNAKGKEGTVYGLLSRPGFCAKIYFDDQLSKEKEAKINYMVSHPPTFTKNDFYRICWPVESLYKGNKFVGFLMPLAFDNSISLYELCRPKINTKRLGQKWSLTFGKDKKGILARLKICKNISTAIHLFHKTGTYVIVDLKPDNVLITDRGKISILDCDSIQITNGKRLLFAANVATPEYIPPELYNRRNSANQAKKESWDLFSMSVIFYQIIFGLHPFSASFKGKYKDSTTIDSNIKLGLFVHGKKRQHIATLPAPHMKFSIIPNNIKTLFNRAFDLSFHMPDVRPTAEEWGKTLYNELSLSNNNVVRTNRTRHNKGQDQRHVTGFSVCTSQKKKKMSARFFKGVLLGITIMSLAILFNYFLI